ncbi:hypothetical protein [Pantanalinema sp. GBBB05]|uniref:hypothetical protein n=1 Tax=Pantanalinema sp. GBBB05 TaxID=2604139 RepID=UPI001DF4C883|nr:hypothetical protein [Pantanalinema sp. GBBB05]
MVAYNFKACFAPLVESRQKRQTIRAEGKRKHAKPGDALQLYTGMRTKVCRKLLNPDPECASTHEIEIRDRLEMRIDGIPQTLSEQRQVALDDGFDSLKAFHDFFESVHGLPFKGKLIRW